MNHRPHVRGNGVLVQKYIGSAFDVVKEVAENIKMLEELLECLKGGSSVSTWYYEAQGGETELILNTKASYATLYIDGLKQPTVGTYTIDGGKIKLLNGAELSQGEVIEVILQHTGEANVVFDKYLDLGSVRNSVDIAGAIELKLRKGSTDDISRFVPAQGEVIVNTTDGTLHVGDGFTVGGIKQISVKVFEDTIDKLQKRLEELERIE